MPSFSSAQLARWTGGRWTTPPTTALTGFTIDSRHVHEGQVFVALKTAKRDGHDFLLAAQNSKASAALVSKPNLALNLPQLIVVDPSIAFQAIAREHRRTFAGPVIGITGSAGKTSTKNLLALLLGREAGGVLATEGNLNNHLGVPLTLTRLDPAKHKFAVIEAGISAPGDMGVLAAMIEPDLALTTLVAAAHTQELGSVDGVAREKSRLSAALRPAGVAIFPTHCTRFSAFCVLNVQRMLVERTEVMRPGEAAKDKIFYALTQRGDSTAITLAYGLPPPLTFNMWRVTDGMAQNAVIAICAALSLGVAPETVQERLAEWAPSPLRGEWRRQDGRLLYLDCYNANPASMADALNTFCAVTSGAEPRLFILGGMEELGADAPQLHRDLGRSLPLRSQDFLTVVAEHAADVKAGAIEGGALETQIAIEDTTVPIAARLAEFQGSVFVKGSRRYALEKTLPPSGAEKPETADLFRSSASAHA